MVKEEFRLLDNGKVEYTFQTEKADLKKLDNETIIGDFYNVGVSHIESKEKCIEDLQEKYDYSQDNLEKLEQQYNEIIINDSIAEELKQIVENSKDLFKAIGEIKDFSGKDYVSNNPKKFGKMLKEARLLKENHIGELKEIDKVTGLHTRKLELEGQIKLYKEQTEKIKNQLEEVKKL